MSVHDQTIYYLPGRGGRVDEGLGLALQSRGLTVYGRHLFGEFQRLRFSDQIQVIADDLKHGFWNENALVVANSFGAYLFLHAQTLLDPFPGKVLLLSPIIGATAAPGNGPRFGVPVGTVTNWEQGRRQPTGAAKVLLALLARKPSLVADLYPAPRPQPRWSPGGPDPSKMTAEEMLAEIGQILAVGILRMREISLRNSSPTMP